MSRVGSHSSELNEGVESKDYPSRSRIPTEKGLNYSKQLAEKELTKSLRTWRNYIDTIKTALLDNPGLLTLQEMRQTLDANMNDLLEIKSKLLKLYDVQESEELTSRLELWDEQYSNYYSILNDRINEICMNTNKQNMTNIDRTSRSSRSSRASQSSRKAIILSKHARLKTELSFLEIENEKEVELKRIQMMKELAANQAEIEAIDKFEQEEQNIEKGSATSCKLPEQVQSPLERVREYVKEQSDSLQLSQRPMNNSNTSPQISELSQDTQIGPLNPHVSIFAPSTSPPIPNPFPRDQTTIENPPGLTERSVSQHPTTDVPHSQHVHGFHQSNPLYTVSTDTRNPFTSSTYPRVTVPTPSTQPNPAMTYPQPNPGSTSHGQPRTASDEPLTRLADLLSERRIRDNLPLPEPDIFRGDLLQFPQWIKSFETIIESQTQKISERLFYLGKYIAGEAKDAIRGYISQNSAEAYEKAKALLWKRYGNPFLVADAYKKKIYEWPKILPNDSMGLRKFSDFLNQTLSAMQSTTFLNVLDDPTENRRMAKKLPSYIINRWSRQVDRWIYESGSNTSTTTISRLREQSLRYPSFADFCQFVEKEARIACNPVISMQAFKIEESKTRRSSAHSFKDQQAKSLKTGANEGIDDKRSCLYCKNNDHDLSECTKFREVSLPDRRAFVISKRLCWGCLKWGHINNACQRKRTCKTCKGTHPSSMHEDRPKDPSKEPADKKEDSAAKESEASVSNRTDVDTGKNNVSISHSLIVPVWVHHESAPDKEVLVYALLDEQSDACFVKTTTSNALNLKGIDVNLKLSTMLGEEDIKCQKVSGLVIRGVNDVYKIPLPKTYTRNMIPAQRNQIPDPRSAELWPHLQPIAKEITKPQDDVEVGLLIGANCPRAIKPREVIPGKDDDPYAIKTILGWGIIGKISSSNEFDDVVDVNRIETREFTEGKDTKHCCFVFKSKTKEIINPNQVNKMFEQDFSEIIEDKPLSYEDRKFIDIVSKEIHRSEDGHYEIPLPLKDPDLKLPNNREQALNRLNRLKRKMESDPQYKSDYVAFMNEIIQNGYAEKVVQDHPQAFDEHEEKNWYLPHHGIYHPKKPGKIRVVFDCSVEYKGESLNRSLLSGPDLTNSLLGVLCRFRQEPVAITCDIEKMFYQVYVNKEHRNLLRFLWWEEGDLNRDPVEYRMTVHLFGATSSPGCANAALKTTANDAELECGSRAAKFVRNNFYVDDGLTPLPTPEDAVSLVEETKALCGKGGFRLHKFMSNSKEVLKSIAPSDLAKGVQDLNLACDRLPIERTLGVQWCADSDTFQFRIVVSERPMTRRGILSTISSIYDPLGLLAPFILLGKQILQELCRNKANWDDDIPERMRSCWERWLYDLHILARLNVPRCYKPDNFGKIVSVELHNFSDASKDGYGQCSYLRLINEKNEIHCVLVMAKSRVAPMKMMTIPRLELTAALISAKVSALLRRELDFDDIKQVFWSDSRVVLGYINNLSRRFHVFVANRTQQIHDLSSATEW